MNNPVQSLVNLGVIPPVAFPVDSRYYGSATRTWATPNGQPVSYLARRFVPQPGASNYATLARHAVRQNDRLDLIAAAYLGDPLMFWLLCDANGAVRPNELIETPGRVLNIATPQGAQGVSNA